MTQGRMTLDLKRTPDQLRRDLVATGTLTAREVAALTDADFLECRRQTTSPRRFCKKIVDRARTNIKNGYARCSAPRHPSPNGDMA